MVFDEHKFPFSSLHPNAGAQLRSEILLLPESLRDGVVNTNVPPLVTSSNQAAQPLAAHNIQLLKEETASNLQQSGHPVQPAPGTIPCAASSSDHAPAGSAPATSSPGRPLRARHVRHLCLPRRGRVRLHTRRPTCTGPAATRLPLRSGSSLTRWLQVATPRQHLAPSRATGGSAVRTTGRLRFARPDRLCRRQRQRPLLNQRRHLPPFLLDRQLVYSMVYASPRLIRTAQYGMVT